MATYMKIPGIPGDVTAKGHEQWIAVDHIDFDIKRTLKTEPGRIVDREGSRPSVSELTLHKRMDKSSPLLFSEACVGKAKSTIQLAICQTNDTLTPYAEITVHNAIISGYAFRQSNTSHEHYPHEVLHISYDKIEIRYTPFDSQHQAESPIPAGYDLRQGVAT